MALGLCPVCETHAPCRHPAPTPSDHGRPSHLPRDIPQLFWYLFPLIPRAAGNPLQDEPQGKMGCPSSMTQPTSRAPSWGTLTELAVCPHVQLDDAVGNGGGSWDLQHHVAVLDDVPILHCWHLQEGCMLPPVRSGFPRLLLPPM